MGAGIRLVRRTAARAILAAVLSSRMMFAGGNGAPSSLRVTFSPPEAPQGGVVVVSAVSPAVLSRLVFVDGSRRVLFERGEDGRSFRALLGVDFEEATGPRTLVLEGVAESGAVEHTVVFCVTRARFPLQRLMVDPRFVEVPEAERERVKADQERVAAVWKKPDPLRRFAGAFGLPVEARSEENFGAKRVYNGESRSRHTGLDLAAAEGTPVLAPAPARVAIGGDLYFSGGTVILDHGAGLFTMYFHLSRVDVKEGELVASGQRLGAVGHTGRATGPHLHWAARLDGARVNPESLRKLPPWPLPGGP